VLGTTQNFSIRIAMKGILCATVLTLVLIETLALAASARATEAGGRQEGAPPSQETTTLPQEAASAGETGTANQEATAPEQAGEGEAPASQPSQSAKEPSQAQETSPPAQESTPSSAEEVTPPAAEATPPVEEVAPTAQEVVSVQEVVQTTQEVAPPAIEEVLVPVVSEVTQTTEEVLAPVSEALKPIVSIEERAKEDPAHVEALAEPTKEAAQAEQVAAQTIAGTPAPSVVTQAGATATSASSPVAGEVVVDTVLGSPPAITVGESREPSTKSTAISIDGLGLTAAQRAGELSCELSGLTVRMREDCSAGLLSGASLLSVVSVEPVAEASTAHKRVLAGGGYSEPAGGDHSVLPPPGPGPGGSVGGSAASGSGAAPSGFFTFGGLRLLHAPCAMRRLRLSCRPWRTAFFVLIPERPG
jgi:hypothetical protein